MRSQLNSAQLGMGIEIRAITLKKLERDQPAKLHEKCQRSLKLCNHVFAHVLFLFLFWKTKDPQAPQRFLPPNQLQSGSLSGKYCACVDLGFLQMFYRRKMSDWSTRDQVTLPNSKWRQYFHRLFIPVERRLIAG